MATLNTLEQQYEVHLDRLGLRRRLEQELALEDDYAAHVHSLVGEAGLEDQRDFYQGPEACYGGGSAAQLILRRLASDMPVQAQQVKAVSIPSKDQQYEVKAFTIPAREIFCGLVPNGDLGVVTEPHPSGGVIYFDVSLWFFLRFASQQVASALASITDDPFWGADNNEPNPGVVLGDYLDGYVRRGRPLRGDTRLRVMRGQRELFRRDLNRACVAWTIAHEYGLLVAAATEPETKYVSPPGGNEEAEVLNEWKENQADLCACSIVQPSILLAMPLACMMAPTLVLSMQAFILKTSHKEGIFGQLSPHLDPEIRACAAAHIAFPGYVESIQKQGERFRVWLWDALGTEQMYKEDVPDGVIIP